MSRTQSDSKCIVIYSVFPRLTSRLREILELHQSYYVHSLAYLPVKNFIKEVLILIDGFQKDRNLVRMIKRLVNLLTKYEIDIPEAIEALKGRTTSLKPKI